jgi:hypothetical protein
VAFFICASDCDFIQITLAIMLHAASWQLADVTTFTLLLWAGLPYIVLLISNLRIHRRGASFASGIAILAASLIVVIFSVWLYYDSVYVSKASTSALIFVFLPGYTLVATAIIYYVTKALTSLVARRRKV